MKLKLLVICLFSLLNFLSNSYALKKSSFNTGIKSMDKILYSRKYKTGEKDPDTKRNMLEKIQANG